MFGRIDKGLLNDPQNTGTNQSANAKQPVDLSGGFKAVLQRTVVADKKKPSAPAVNDAVKSTNDAVKSANDAIMSAMDTYLSVDKIDDTNLFPETENIFPSTGFKKDISAIASDRNAMLQKMSADGRLHGSSDRWNSNAIASNKLHNKRSYKQADRSYQPVQPGSAAYYNASSSLGDDSVQAQSKGANLDRYEDYINEAASNYGLAPALIKAVIVAESSGNAYARSRSGARGLMQLMPSTAADLGVTDSYDAKQNIDGGSRYLRQLLDKYDGNVHQALAAYNWGMGNLDRRPEKMPQQTKDYVAKVEGYYRGYTEDSSQG